MCICPFQSPNLSPCPPPPPVTISLFSTSVTLLLFSADMHRFCLLREETVFLQLFPGCPHSAICCENCGKNNLLWGRRAPHTVWCCFHNCAPSYILQPGLWPLRAGQDRNHTPLWRACAITCPAVEWIYKGFWGPKEKMYPINQWWCINRLLLNSLFTECNSLIMAFCTVYHHKTMVISPQWKWLW